MDWSKFALALIPIGLAGLVSLAWQNSHALASISHNLDAFAQRFDRDEKELEHLRALIEGRFGCPPASGGTQR